MNTSDRGTRSGFAVKRPGAVSKYLHHLDNGPVVAQITDGYRVVGGAFEPGFLCCASHVAGVHLKSVTESRLHGEATAPEQDSDE